MSDTSDSTLAGAGSGAATGATAGATVGSAFGGVGAVPGAVVGGAIGAVAGGASGYFQGRALSKRKAAEDEARRRLEEAQNQYATGMARNDARYQAQLADTLKQQQQMGMERFTKTPSGQDYAKTLNAATATATGQPTAEGPNTAYTRASQGENQNRYAAALAPAAHEAALAHVQQLSATTAQQYGLKSSELNAQLAHIANTHGIERAQLAARYAAATGQYPLDVQRAQRAGGSDAVTGGLIQGGLGLTAGVASAYGAGHRAAQERERNQAMMDQISLMQQGSGGSSMGYTTPTDSNLS